jgi:hypothetical protein
MSPRKLINGIWFRDGIRLCSRCNWHPVAKAHFTNRDLNRCRHCIDNAHKRRTRHVCIDCEKAPRAGDLTRCTKCQKKRLARELKQRQFDGAYDPFSKHFDSEKFLGQSGVELGWAVQRIARTKKEAIAPAE